MTRIYAGRKYYISDERCYSDFFRIESVDLWNKYDVKIETDWLTYRECEERLTDPYFFIKKKISLPTEIIFALSEKDLLYSEIRKLFEKNNIKIMYREQLLISLESNGYIIGMTGSTTSNYRYRITGEKEE